jgi:hypothetical protein
MPPHADPALRQPHTAWYRQPVVWLGVLVFAASIAGCVWIIMAGQQHADTPLETGRSAIFGVPATPHSAPPPPAASSP